MTVKDGSGFINLKLLNKHAQFIFRQDASYFKRLLDSVRILNPHSRKLLNKMMYILFISDTNKIFKFILQENGKKLLESHINTFRDRAFSYIIPVPPSWARSNNHHPVYFVLAVDWDEECSHLRTR